MENQSGVSFRQRILQNLSDEELKNKLCCQMLSDDAFDMEQVDAILAEMERRGLDKPPMSAQEAWEEFEENYLGTEPFYTDAEDALTQTDSEKTAPKKRRSLRVLWTLAAAVLIVMSILVGVQASGVDVLGAMARWTEEVFSFGRITDEENSRASAKPSRNERVNFESLQDALDFYSITEVAEPAWLPEGYALDSVNECCNDAGLEIYAAYSNEDSEYINIVILESDGVHFSYCEKSEMVPIGAKENGVIYYTVENKKSHVITWLTSNYECAISGTLSQKELQRIALSTEGGLL